MVWQFVLSFKSVFRKVQVTVVISLVVLVPSWQTRFLLYTVCSLSSTL